MNTSRPGMIGAGLRLIGEVNVPEAWWGSPSGQAADPESQPKYRAGSVFIGDLQLWVHRGLSVVR